MSFISKAISGNADNRHARDMQMREHEMEKLRMAEERLYREQLERQATADRQANKEMIDQMNKRSSDDHDANMIAIGNLTGGNKADPSVAASAGGQVSHAAVGTSGSSNGVTNKNGGTSSGDGGHQNADNDSTASKAVLVNNAAANPH